MTWLVVAAALHLATLPVGGQTTGGTSDPSVAAVAPGAGSVPSLRVWLGRIAEGLGRVGELARSGRAADARQVALRLYLDEYELLETHYGAGGERSTPGSVSGIGAIEGRFHELLRAADAGSARMLADELRAEVLAMQAGAPDVPPPAGAVATPTAASGRAASMTAAAGGARPAGAGAARTPEVAAVLARLANAEAAYGAGQTARARTLVERAYLDGIEPLESRLPPARVHEIERLVHLGLRASIAAGAPAGEVRGAFGALRARLLDADAMLGPGAPAWLGATNAFIVILREGLEAVLLVAALLGYLAAVGAGRKARRQIYAGVAAGIVATLATWGIASVVIPIGGASRELVEGITGLLAVAVLMYVSNWLFQKTYVHDWKQYLRQHLGKAMTAGSGLAMASLAFAAVYREGFETVLFYRALLFDAGPAAVLGGAIPGAVLIGAIGVGIIRLGVKLPLARMFAVTNAVLLYLAFTFVGKGLYNLQEAGLFTPHAIPAWPDSPVLRQLLGVYPLVETLLAQLLFTAVIVATYLYYREGMARRGTPAPATAIADARLASADAPPSSAAPPHDAGPVRAV